MAQNSDNAFIIEKGKLLKYTGAGGEVCIPDGVKHIAAESFFQSNITRVTIPQSVKKIGTRAFCDCKKLVSVEFPSELRTIDSYAFSYCTALTAVTVPDSIEELARSIFQGCTALTTVQLPRNLKVIRYEAFSNCSHLSTLQLPENLQVIEHAAFSRCSSLKHISLPDTLSVISHRVFEFCTRLNEITFPANIETVEPSAFTCCTNLKHIHVADENPYLCEEHGMLFTKDRQKLLLCIDKQAKKIKIPSEIREIADSVFENFQLVTQIEFPDELRTIGTCSFYNCKNLKELVLPPKITSIHPHAFSYCYKLTRLQLPESLHEIGYQAFDYCPLEEVVFLGNKLKIGSRAFGNEKTPPNFIAPNMAITSFPTEYRLQATKNFAMQYLSSTETKEGTIPFREGIITQNLNYIKSQRRRLWREPALLRVLIQNKFIPQKELTEWLDETAAAENTELSAILLEYRNQNFSQEEFDKMHTLEQNRQMKWLQTGELPISEIKKIWAFKKLEDGTLAITRYKGTKKDITVPSEIKKNRVTAIGCRAFCPQKSGNFQEIRVALHSIAISEGVTEIGAYAFAYNEELAQIKLPQSLLSIGTGAFEYCASLTLHAPAGSYAQQFAQENNIPFIAEE